MKLLPLLIHIYSFVNFCHCIDHQLNVMLHSRDIPGPGFKTTSGRHIKFWTDHDYFSTRKRKIISNQQTLSSRLGFQNEESRCLNVFLGKDGFSMRVQRPIFTDVDATEYTSAFCTKSLLDLNQIIPDRFTITKSSQPLNVHFVTVWSKSFPQHPHWSIQVGDLEVQLTTDQIDNPFIGNNREAGIIISKSLEEAARTMHTRTNRWQIDPNTNYFNMKSIKHTLICTTRKSQTELWKDIDEVVRFYLLEGRYNEPVWNCYMFSVMLINKICNQPHFNWQYIKDLSGGALFNALMATITAPLIIPSNIMDYIKRHKDERTSLTRKNMLKQSRDSK